MNYLNFALFLFLVGFIAIGSQIAELDIENEFQRDIYNYTESTIKLPEINIYQNHPVERTKGIINEGRLYIIIESFTNFLLVSSEQIVKMGIEFGYQNPDINYSLILKYLLYLVIAMLIFYLIKPVGYLLIGIVMIGILIKDSIEKRRKRKKNKS